MVLCLVALTDHSARRAGLSASVELLVIFSPFGLKLLFTPIFGETRPQIIHILHFSGRHVAEQACAAEIAVLYAALRCKQNKRYHTSARLTKTRDRCSNVNNHGTDRQTDRVRRNMRPPPIGRIEGRIIMLRIL